MSTTVTAPHKGQLISPLRNLAPGLVALPIGCFILFVWTYAVNVPWFDDIDAFLGFTLAYIDSATLPEKIYNIFVPNNEHRIVVAKLITLAMYYLTGEVNFRWLILIALLFILGTLALLGRVFQSMRLPLLAFLPVPFLFLQPEYYLTSLWSIPGLQHPVVICLTLASLYMLTQAGRGQFPAAVVLQVLATLSMSNGLMGWIAGGVVLALSRKWYRLGGWVAGSVVAVFLYFYNFQSAGRTGESLAYSLSHPLQALAGFFTFTGAMFDVLPAVQNNWRYGPPLLAGVVLSAVVLGLVYRMNRSVWSSGVEKAEAPLAGRRLFFTGTYIFLYGNVAIISLLRLRYGFQVMVVSNYMIYPATMGALIYLNALSESTTGQAQRWFMRAGLVVSVLIWAFAYGVYWPKMAFRKHMLLTGAVNQKHNDIGLGATWGTPFAHMARSVMRESVRRGVYHYPNSYLAPVESLLHMPAKASPGDSCLPVQLNGGGVIYQARTAPDAYQNALGQAAMLLQSDQRTILYASETPFAFPHFWLNRPVTGVRAEILTIILAAGTYKIGVLTPSEPERPIRLSCQTLTIP